MGSRVEQVKFALLAMQRHALFPGVAPEGQASFLPMEAAARDAGQPEIIA